MSIVVNPFFKTFQKPLKNPRKPLAAAGKEVFQMVVALNCIILYIPCVTRRGTTISRAQRVILHAEWSAAERSKYKIALLCKLVFMVQCLIMKLVFNITFAYIVELCLFINICLISGLQILYV